MQLNRNTPFNVKRAIFGALLGLCIGPLLIAVVAGALGFHGYELVGCIIGAPVGFLLGPRASKKTLVWTGIVSVSVFVLVNVLFALFLIITSLIGIAAMTLLRVVPPWVALLAFMISGTLLGLILAEVSERAWPTRPKIRLGFLTATHRRRRAFITGSLTLILPALVVLWCMTDGSVAVKKDYRPEHLESVARVTHNVYLYPFLQPRGDLIRRPGRFFKECVTFQGPYLLYVTIRDYGKVSEGVQINACRMFTPDHQWGPPLEISQGKGAVHLFQVVTGTDKYTEAGFTARLAGQGPGPGGANIVPPADAGEFILEIQCDIVTGGQKESFQKTFTLLPAPNEYSSYGFNRAIAM